MSHTIVRGFFLALFGLTMAVPGVTRLAGQDIPWGACLADRAGRPCAEPDSVTDVGEPPHGGSLVEPTEEERQRQPRDPASAELVAGANGFQLRSADGAFSLQLRGGVQHDGRFFLDDPDDVRTHAFELRRVRTDFLATLHRDFGFRLNLDYIGGRAEVLDALLEARFSPALRLRFGKTKGPVGLERLQTPFQMVFAERAFPTLLVPNREVGAQLDGALRAGRVNYALAITNGVVDGGSDAGPTSDNPELSGRLFLHPFRGVATAGPLQGLGLGLAATQGVGRGTESAPGLPGLRSSGRELFLRYRNDGTGPGTTLIDGSRTRLAPQGYLYWRSAGLIGEWVRSSFPVVRGEHAERLANTAWNLTASVVLTGEPTSYRGITPRHAFDPAQRRWGAFEVAARVHTLRIDPASFPLFADPRWPQSATAVTVGMNWYLNTAVRTLLNFERTTYTAAPEGTPRPAENLLVSRFQVAF